MRGLCVLNFLPSTIYSVVLQRGLSKKLGQKMRRSARRIARVASVDNGNDDLAAAIRASLEDMPERPKEVCSDRRCDLTCGSWRAVQEFGASSGRRGVSQHL